MREVVEFPDAEKAVIDFLIPILDAYGGGVGIDVRGGGGRFVRVRRIGGTEMDPAHDRPTVDVMVWHESDLQRMKLAQRLWGALRAAEGEATSEAVLYYSSTLLGPRQMPDPADDNRSVALFTVQLITRRR